MSNTEDLKILRWSGVWRKGNEVRAGVRLSDRSDGLLVASVRAEGVGHGGGDAEEIRYALLVQGEDSPVVPAIPDALRKIMESKLRNGPERGVVTLRHLEIT